MIRTPHDKKEACKIALSHRLFVPGWELRRDLWNHWKYDFTVRYIVLYYEDEIPIGVGIITRWDDIKIFVRLKHRRRGIGREIVAALREKMAADKSEFIMDAGYGVPGSLQFWEAMKVPLWE